MVAINKFTEMKIETFYITSENEFSNTFREWSDKLDLPVNLLDGKNDELHEVVDGILLFHENHDISKDSEEIISTLDKSNIPAHKVDINGTLTATVTNFQMWIERNNCKNVVVLGNPEVSKNENLYRFLEKLEA